jgi:hypothetical protein
MPADIELRNTTNLKFEDISCEARRTYTMRGEVVVTIEKPQWLNVSKSNGHRILDGKGNCHYIPGDAYDHIEWFPKEGCPHFVK